MQTEADQTNLNEKSDTHFILTVGMISGQNKLKVPNPPSLEVHIGAKLLSKDALEWAAQRGGGVTDPGGVQRAFRCCVEGHGLARTIGEGQTNGWTG